MSFAKAFLFCMSTLAGMPASAIAAKLKPLAEMKPVGGCAIYFDPAKVTAVYKAVVAIGSGCEGDNATVITAHGRVMTVVLGISTYPLPIDSDGASFLEKYGIAPEFVKFEAPGGYIYLKASSIKFISKPYGPEVDARVKSFIFPGPPGTGRISLPYQAFQTPEVVKSEVDKVRVDQDSAE